MQSQSALLGQLARLAGGTGGGGVLDAGQRSAEMHWKQALSSNPAATA